MIPIASQSSLALLIIGGACCLPALEAQAQLDTRSRGHGERRIELPGQRAYENPSVASKRGAGAAAARSQTRQATRAILNGSGAGQGSAADRLGRNVRDRAMRITAGRKR